MAHRYSEDGMRPLRWYRELSSSQGRKDSGAFLIEGERAVGQFIRNNPDKIIELLCVPETENMFHGFPKRMISRSKMHSICSAKTPQGIAAVAELPDGVYDQRLPREIGDSVLLLEDVQDPGNIGTLIRTGAAFGFSGVLMSRQCADPFSAKCVQSSAGTILTLWVRRTDGYLDLAGELVSAGYVLTAADLSGVPEYGALEKSDRFILALGNEGGGLSEDVLALAAHRVKIPIADEKVQSLNVALSGAILMHRRYERLHTDTF